MAKHRHTQIWQIDTLKRRLDSNNEEAEVTMPDGRKTWVPARHYGRFDLLYRFKAAVLVLSGKADALQWRGQ